jgi:uncharacterized membrane protein
MKTPASISIPTDTETIERPRHTLLWPAILLAAALITAATVYLNTDTPVRGFVVFAFLLVAPGLAFIRLFHIQDWMVELVLSIGLSVSIDTIVALILLYTQKWFPLIGFGIILAITGIGVILQISPVFRRSRRLRA